MHTESAGTSRRQRLLWALLAVAVAVAAGYWLTSGRHTATPRVVEGWAMPNADGTAISLHESRDATPNPGEGYVIAGAEWRGPDGSWRDGASLPTCVGTDTSSMTHVRLGVVNVTGRGSHVAWLECMSQPGA